MCTWVVIRSGGGDRAPREPGCGQGFRDGEKQIWGKVVMGRSGEGAGYLQTSQTRWGSPHPKSLVSGTPKELKAGGLPPDFGQLLQATWPGMRHRGHGGGDLASCVWALGPQLLL